VKEAAAAGVVLGFLVAAQIGPISLLCVRSVLRGRWAVGLGIGYGAALVDTVYAALGCLGAAGVMRWSGVRPLLGLAGAAVLVALGVRTLIERRRIRLDGDAAVPVVGSVRAAFGTSLVATAANPLTIASWAAIFSAAATAKLSSTAATAIALIVGVGVGSAGWFTTLATAAQTLRRRISSGVLQAMDAVTGVGLIAFGIALAVRTVIL
jgi:threonine/homoserine/homoserine lactone efflux protein